MKANASTKNIQFSELNDLFLAQKGKKLRNLQKKLDKIIEQEKLVKKGEISANEDMQAKFATKPALKAEVKELKDLCDLYIKSNPDYDKKVKKAELTQDDINKQVADALRSVSQLLTLSSLLKEDPSLVEASEKEIGSVHHMASLVSGQDFQKSADPEMISSFMSLKNNSDDLVCEGGCTFEELKSVLTSQFVEGQEFRSHTIQRIAEKAAASMRVADEPASAAAATTDDAPDQTATDDGAKDAADKGGDEEEKKEDGEKKDDAGDEKAADTKDGGDDEKAPEVQKKEDGDQEDDQNKRGRGGRGRGGRGGDRGDRRGGRGGRGGQRRNQDPDDDFIEETGQRKQNRGRGGRGGRGRGGERGDRRFRGDRRGGDRGRPQTAQPGGNSDAAPMAAAGGASEQV